RSDSGAARTTYERRERLERMEDACATGLERLRRPGPRLRADRGANLRVRCASPQLPVRLLALHPTGGSIAAQDLLGVHCGSGRTGSDEGICSPVCPWGALTMRGIYIRTSSKPRCIFCGSPGTVLYRELRDRLFSH